MSNVQHSSLVAGVLHEISNYHYANAAARTGASGFVSGDLGKVAWQQDNNSLWLLTATTPTWVGLTGLVDPTTTKGDLIVHGSTTDRLAAGSDGQVLTADSTQTAGVKWAAGGGGGGGGTPAENAAALLYAYDNFT